MYLYAWCDIYLCSVYISEEDSQKTSCKMIFCVSMEFMINSLKKDVFHRISSLKVFLVCQQDASKRTLLYYVTYLQSVNTYLTFNPELLEKDRICKPFSFF